MTKNTDPRVVPVAKAVCKLFGDDWTPNQSTYKKWARELLVIADCAALAGEG